MVGGMLPSGQGVGKSDHMPYLLGFTEGYSGRIPNKLANGVTLCWEGERGWGGSRAFDCTRLHRVLIHQPCERITYCKMF